MKKRTANPVRIARWISRGVVGYTDTGTPIYEGEAQTDTGRFVRARGVGAQIEEVD